MSSPLSSSKKIQLPRLEARTSIDADWIKYSEIGTCRLRKLIASGEKFMQPGIFLYLKNDAYYVQKPSILLCSLIKKILEAIYEHQKQLKIFRGDLSDSNSYGLCLFQDKDSVKQVHRVFLLNSNSEDRERGTDIDKELEIDRSRVYVLINSLLSPDERHTHHETYLPYGARQFLRLLRFWITNPSEEVIFRLIEHHSLSAWHTRLFKTASLSALFKTDRVLLTYKTQVNWRDKVPRTGILRRTLDMQTYEDTAESFLRYLRNLFSHSLDFLHFNFRLSRARRSVNSSVIEHHEVLELLVMEVFRDELESVLNIRI